MGSAGTILLGDEAGSRAHPRLMAGAGKEGRIYLLDRDNMGRWRGRIDSQIVATTEAGDIAGMFGNPAYFNHSVYFCGSGRSGEGVLRLRRRAVERHQFAVADPIRLPGLPADHLGQRHFRCDRMGLMRLIFCARTMRANLAERALQQQSERDRDALGPYVKFTPPMVANGKVYAGTQNSLNVYGLLPGATVAPVAANIASGDRRLLAPGSIVAIHGSGLAQSTATAAGFPLPATLGGASVSVNGTPAPLFYASPGEIRAQVPFDTASGQAGIVVTAGGRQVAQIQAMIQIVAPGLFMGEQGRALVENADGSINSSAQPAAAGTEIVAYLTGLGAVNPAVATGAAPSISLVTESVAARIGNKDATIVFAGLAPGYAGLYQLNLIVPELPPGDYPLRVSAANVPSNTAVISIR